MKENFFNPNLMVPNNVSLRKISDLTDSGRQSNMVFKSIAYPSKIYYPHIQKFIKKYTEEGAVVLDSFSGSGSTGIAAAIENRKAVLIDDSPYANFIQENIFGEFDRKEIEVEYKKLLENLEEIFNEIYYVESNDGHLGTIQTIISSNIYKCRCCEIEVDLNNNETGKRSEYLCPNCKNVFNIAEQTTKDLKIDNRRPVEVILKYKDIKSGKVVTEKRKVTDKDIKIWNKKLQLVKEKYSNLWEPSEKIVYNRSYPRVGGWPGFPIHSKVGALFSERNLLALKILNNYIETEIRSNSTKKFLKFVFTESLFRSSSRLFKTSGIKNVYHIPPIGKEQNVLVVFTRKYKTILKCNIFIDELMKSEQKLNVQSIKGNARKLEFDDNLFDYAFIDPPYGGIVPYAELNLFYSAWLDEKEDLENEVNIPMDYDKKAEWAEIWGNMIEEAFSEVYRVLKPGAYFTIVFQSKFDTIWNNLRDVMINRLGFEFVEFVGNERGSTFHTNSLNDTNPLSAYITYRKPIELNEKLSLDADPFKYLDEKFAVNNYTFRRVQDELINIVHKYNLRRLPSDKEIEIWIEKKRYDKK